MGNALDVDEEDVNESQDNEEQTEGSQDSESAEQIAEVSEEAKQDEETKEPEFVLTVGDDEIKLDGGEEEEATPLIKQLRSKIKEQERQLKEVKRAQQVTQVTPTARVVDLENKLRAAFPNGEPAEVDYDFDTEAYKKALRQYIEMEGALKSEKKSAEDAAREEENRFLSDLRAKEARYVSEKEKVKTEFGVNNYDDLEQIVIDNLSESKRLMLLRVSENPELLVPVLASKPDLLNKLKSINDPVMLAAEIGRLEGKKIVIKRNEKTSKPSPETVIKGAAGGGGYEYNLEKAKEKGYRTGDMREYHKMRREMKAKTRSD